MVPSGKAITAATPSRSGASGLISCKAGSLRVIAMAVQKTDMSHYDLSDGVAAPAHACSRFFNRDQHAGTWPPIELIRDVARTSMFVSSMGAAFRRKK